MSDTTDLNSTTAVRGPTDLGARTNVREPTDVHRTKIHPDDPRLRIERPRSRTLRKGPALIALGAVAALGTIALAVAFGSSGSAPDPKPSGQTPEVNAVVVPIPDVIKDPPAAASSGYDGGSPLVDAQAATAPASQVPDQRSQARTEEFFKARGSGLFAPMDDTPSAEAAAQRPGPVAATTSTGAIASTPPQTPESSRALDPNMQERKNDFLSKTGSSSAEYLTKALTTPVSPYEVKAGSVIPTVLLTGINSDLPGQIVGQVRENVYDTVSGNYLLIPQGSRLLAAYDSMVAWGQERVLVCWNRLIRPDGSSITLECMPGVDLAGYSGFADEVDNHWWKIISGAVFSSVLAATAQRSQGDVTSLQPTFPQVWASNAAGQINQAGQQLTSKNLQIQPTITVRPGFSINVLVTKDIVIAPYNRQGVTP